MITLVRMIRSPKEIESRFRVRPGTDVSLKDYDCAWNDSDDLRVLGKSDLKEKARTLLAENTRALAAAQEQLWANNTRSILVVLQGMDTSGKDGTIKHVMSGINPQGCAVHSFKRPTPEELDHTFLWRHMRVLPERGKIVIFNRSYYEDVLVVKVHPELLKLSQLPQGTQDKGFWKKRYEDINNLEMHLANNGTTVIKFFLNISKGEQRQRLLERLNTPEKHWKFDLQDIEERKYWDDYQRVYEKAFERTSTEEAPWYIIPSDNKWIARAIISTILTVRIKSLDLPMPEVSEAMRAKLDEARKGLEQEAD